MPAPLQHHADGAALQNSPEREHLPVFPEARLPLEVTVAPLPVHFDLDKAYKFI